MPEPDAKPTAATIMLPKSSNWQHEAADDVCRTAQGQLPNIRRACDGVYVIIDPADGLTKIVQGPHDKPFNRWCHELAPCGPFDPKFVDALWYRIDVLRKADPIDPIDLTKRITKIPCREGGWISLKTGKKCDPPSEDDDMEYCPYVLNLTADEAEYNPNHKPTGRLVGDLRKNIGEISYRQSINFIAASIPGIPANRRVINLIGPPRSGKNTAGDALGLLGLASLHVDFSSEVSADAKFRPQLADNISNYPVIFINDPENPDGNTVKKFIDPYAQYQKKGIDQTSVFQRATIVMTMNDVPTFKISGMDNKIFFLHTEESYSGSEDGNYLETIQKDGSLVDLWQEILAEGLKTNWEIKISPEAWKHNELMKEGATPFQRWLFQCKQETVNGGFIPKNTPMARIYEHCILSINPDTDGLTILKTLIKHQKISGWAPTDRRDGFHGPSRSEVKRSLMGYGIEFTADKKDAAIRLPYIDLERDPKTLYEQLDLENSTKKRNEPDNEISQLTKSVAALKADPVTAAVCKKLKKTRG